MSKKHRTFTADPIEPDEQPRVVYEDETPAPAYGVVLCTSNPTIENVVRGLVFSRGICIYNLADQGQVDAAEGIMAEFSDRYMRGSVEDAERVYGKGDALQAAIQRAMDEHNLNPVRVLS